LVVLAVLLSVLLPVLLMIDMALPSGLSAGDIERMEDPCESGTQRFKQRPPTAGLLFSDRNGHFVLRAGLRAHEGRWLSP
jgi:hypothetical protein